jgi:ElaB/YqjD/DUF883 family membrane-anchored ribosome-binding protein
MDRNKEYLNDLKDELTSYGKKLSKIQSQAKEKAGTHSQKIQKTLQDALHDATDAYSKLKDASSEEWEPLKKISAKTFNHLKECFEDFLSSSADKSEEYLSQLESYSEEKAELIGEYISKNPLKSILVAIGIGFIVGKITK